MEIDPRLLPAWTPEQRDAVLVGVARGKSRADACKSAGVSLESLRRMVGVDAGFAAALAAAEEEKWSVAETGLFEALESREPWAIRLVVKEAEGLRERWRSAPEVVSVGVEVGPGIERVAELLAGLWERREILEGTGRELERKETAP